jgi:hypothetical protein
MAKTWDQLTQAEKIEVLRSDIERTMTAVNQLRDDLARQVRASGAGFDDLYARLKTVEETLAAR